MSYPPTAGGVCRCGRRTVDSWLCNHPVKQPLLCRWGFHQWGITTWPIMVRWCDRCGQRGLGR